jgi:hypothetical protein
MPRRALAWLLSAVLVLAVAVPLMTDEAQAAPGSGSAPTVAVDDSFTEKLHGMYDEPEEEYWPWARWWLNEGHHTDATLNEEVQKIHDQGLSGVEVLAMPDNGGAYDSMRAYYGWGSAEWVNDTKLLIEKATDLGMGIAMTSGTNWESANLPDTFTYDGEYFTPDNKGALKQLNITTRDVANGGSYSGSLTLPTVPSAISAIYVPEFELQGVYAYTLNSTTSNGSRINSTSVGQYQVRDIVPVDLIATGDVDTNTNTVSYTNSTGYPVQIVAIWLHGTCQTAEPSVATNYTVNYMDPYGIDALKAYWDEYILTPDMEALISENGQVELYMDSLELSCFNRNNREMIWGLEMRQGFEDEYGYDPIPWIPFVRGNHRSGGATSFYEAYNPADKGKTAQVRNDVLEYVTKMYAENTLKPLQAWLHEKGMTLRAEISYNQPFEISTPAEFVDVVETESLDFESQVDRYRFMSGGAHVFDKLFSVEMGALGNATFKMNLDQHTQHIYAGFAAGIQKNVLHGYSSIVGSDQVRWPGNDGMLNTYPERFSERQPSSIHYKEWTTMISRYQKMLQQGVPKMDFAILRTDYHADSLHRRAQALQTPAQYELGHYFRDLTMQQMGYTYDYFAPAILENDSIEFEDGLINPDTMGYQAVILYQEHIALSSAEKLLEFAQQGLPVVFVNGLSEVIECQSDTVYNTWQHGEAASKSLFSTDTDAEVQAVVAQIKALPNARTIDAEANGIDNDAHLALQELGVYPRAAFHETSHNVVTAMRETDDEIYLFAYNHRWDQANAYEVEITLDALGKPYSYNAHTGNAEPLNYTIQNGKTVFTLSINPGDATMAVLDKSGANRLHVVGTTADKAYIANGQVYMVASGSGEYTATLSDGSTVTQTIAAPADIPLASWDLTVERWTADPDGKKVYATEARPAGWASGIIGAEASTLLFGSASSPAYSSTEYIWPTLKSRIDVGKVTELVPWKDIPKVGEFVSGIGYYETAFNLPNGWSGANGAYLDIGSISGQTAAVYVNGSKVAVVNPRDCVADITDFLVAGKNTVKVEVTSILMNALRGLYRPGGLYSAFTTSDRYPGWSGAATAENNQSRDFGMVGDVRIVTYASGRTNLDGTDDVPPTDVGPAPTNPDIVQSPSLSPVSIAESIAVASKIADRPWTGKQIKPAVSIKVSGKLLVANTDYQVSYGANKFIGKGSVTVTGKGNYTGAKTLTFKIVPKKNSVKKITVGKKSAKVYFKKVSAAQKVTGYQVQYRQKGTSKWKTKPVSAKKSVVAIKGLKKGKQYQFRVRAYKTVAKVKYVAPWSAVKTGKKIK